LGETHLGVQNAATAILIGGTILNSELLYLPGALYGILMYIPAGLLLIVLRYKVNKQEQVTA